MADTKDFYELEQEAAEDGTHIPKYPFKAGYIKRDYYCYYADEDGNPADGTSEKLDEAIEKYGSVHISVYYHSQLKTWMDKWFNGNWNLSDIRELLRRSGITKQEELNELSFEDIESVIRLRIIEKAAKSKRDNSHKIILGEVKKSSNDKDKRLETQVCDIVEKYSNSWDPCTNEITKKLWAIAKELISKSNAEKFIWIIETFADAYKRTENQLKELCWFCLRQSGKDKITYGCFDTNVKDIEDLSIIDKINDNILDFQVIASVFWSEIQNLRFYLYCNSKIDPSHSAKLLDDVRKLSFDISADISSVELERIFNCLKDKIFPARKVCETFFPGCPEKRMQDAAFIVKAIDDLGLRELAGQEQQVAQDNGKKEPLEVRVAREIRRNPDLDSPRIAKLVGSTDGTVRGTKAWGNRKQLRKCGPQRPGTRVKTDTSGGYSNTGVQGDVVPVINEPKEHHRDINQMIADFQTGKRDKYPTPEAIAEKLHSEDDPVSVERAKEWLKETESIFDYGDDN